MARNAPPPETIGRFKILEVLGRGGMGEVYKAFDPTLQRTVAVKTVRPDIDRPEYLERMMREAQAAARLSHPNIVTVYEASQVDGLVYIVMEYLQGLNLAELMEKQSLPIERKIAIINKVLEALQHAHGLDVVHRDIKPSNIHVSNDGTIKLMDFGLARVLVADTLTASGNVLGTPHYASPEQLKGETIDRRTDIYSTGVMAYEMLSGRRPFEPDNDSATSLILKVIQQPAEPMNTDISRDLPEIETIVLRAMAKSPAERYQTADEMRVALVHFLDKSIAKISAIELGDKTIDLDKTFVVPSSLVPPSTVPPANVQPIPVRDLTGAEDPAPAPSPSRKWLMVGGAAAAVLIGATVIAYPSLTAVDTTTQSANVSAEGADVNAKPARTPETQLASAAPAQQAPAPAASTVVPPPPQSRDLVLAPKPSAAPSTPAATEPPSPSRTATPVTKEMTAKEMFNDSDSNVAPGLRFRMLQAGAGDAPMDVDSAKDFVNGDRIRFAFESNIDGYLYVAQQGTSGNWTVLFPNPQINGGRNAVKRFQEYEVPQGDWFAFEGAPGTEHVFVFLSKEPLAKLPGFDRPVRSFETGSPAMIAELRTSIASRDLVFTKDPASSKTPQATYIVNKADVGKAVTASFDLKHK